MIGRADRLALGPGSALATLVWPGHVRLLDVMSKQLIIPLDAPDATDSDKVGPKAANLAALARAGLPTPGGFCLTADAYRHQLAHLKIGEMVEAFTDAPLNEQRKLSVEIRLKLYEEPIAPEILE